MKKHYERLYQEIIYPAIYEKKYEKPVETEIETEVDVEEPEGEIELDTGTDIVDTSNRWAKTKTQFQKGNPYRFTSSNASQKKFNFDDLMSDE